MYKSNPNNDKYVYKKRHCYTYIIKQKKHHQYIVCKFWKYNLVVPTYPISILKLLREVVSFIFAGTISQILVPKLEILSEPYKLIAQRVS